jgi:ribonuclease G
MISKEMVISANRHETRVALLEDDQLVEVYFQRANEYSLAGSIHKGRVTRVLPGMQSAFVDLGLERDTFLYVSDFLEEHEDIEQITEERPARASRTARREPSRPAKLEESTAASAHAPAEATLEPGEETASPSAPAEKREDEREDRRGRRSRRRRNRGRGFPESKYATEPAASTPTETTATSALASESLVGPEVGDAQPPAELPLVLPGESLAKYRDSSAPYPETTPEPNPARTPTHAVPAGAQHLDEPASAPAEIAANGNGAAELESESLTEFDEPIHYPPENALPDAPAHLVEGAEWPADQPAAQQFPEDDETGNGTQEAAEAGPEAEPVAAGAAAWLAEVEDSEIQEAVLEAVEGEAAAHEVAAEQVVAEQVAKAAPVPGVEAGMEEPQPVESGAAEVRERGGRYPHRVSRRMRRRMRGQRPGAGPDSDKTSENAPEQQTTAAPARHAGEEARMVSRPASGSPPSISELLKEGQEIIVQIAKEPLGQKGARITSHIALPGRYVVYMPTLEHMGVSRKISSDEERLRLKRILQGRRPGPVGSFITRTAAEGRSEEEIAADMDFLYKLWQDIRQKADRRPAPALLHHDLDIVQRVLRDQLTGNFKAIWIDNEEVYENALHFVERFQPALAGKVKLYTRDAPIFDAFGITNELEKALRPKVWLKSGGYIVINQTEALVAIDVNTGKFVGKSNRLEDTIVKTNTEAIKEIVRQVRLRDLGGIIVIDFIDMDERRNRQKVMQALEEAMRVDRAPYKILQFNDFGLVAITRKRVKQSLERTLCAPCPHCEGAGYIKSVQTVVGEILTEARKMASSIEGKEVMLRVHPDVAKVLKSHQNKYLEELEEVLRRPVLVKGDPLLHHEKFDLA